MAEPRGVLSEESLLETGARLLAVHGYHRMTLDMLAKQFGVKRQAIYYYFPSKERLLERIYETAMETLIQDWELILGTEHPPLDKLGLAMRAFLRRVLERPTAVRVLNRLESELERPFFLVQRQRWHDYLGRLRALYVAARDQRQVPDLDPHVAVYTIIGGIISVAQWFRPEGPLSRQQVEDQIWELVWNGWWQEVQPVAAEGHDVAVSPTISSVPSRDDKHVIGRQPTCPDSPNKRQ